MVGTAELQISKLNGLPGAFACLCKELHSVKVAIREHPSLLHISLNIHHINLLQDITLCLKSLVIIQLNPFAVTYVTIHVIKSFLYSHIQMFT